MGHNVKARRLAVFGLLLGAAVAPGEELVFPPAAIMDWEAHSFEGQTRYTLTEVDGREAIHAQCESATASGLFRRVPVDLRETPILEWRWRVNAVYAGIDETTREGDDYPARLYIVDEHRWMPWRTRALNYVWASERPRHSDWPNAYARQARMIALRSGPSDDGWVSERRDLREDFRRYHGRDVETVEAIAIMTDCDDTGQRAEAWYGTIRLLPEQEKSD